MALGLASLGVVLVAAFEPDTTIIGVFLLTALGIGVIAFSVHVWWRVPRTAAARRHAVLAGSAKLGSPLGPKVPTGLAVDWGFPGRAATLVAFDDDTVILYFYPRASIGGSTLIRRVNEVIGAANDLRMELRRREYLFTAATDFPLPRHGEVTFYLMEADGTRAAGPRIVREVQRSNDPLMMAHELASRLLTLVCGTLPFVVPDPVLSLVTQDRS